MEADLLEIELDLESEEEEEKKQTLKKKKEEIEDQVILLCEQIRRPDLQDIFEMIKKKEGVIRNLKALRHKIQHFDYPDYKRLLSIGRGSKNKIENQGGVVFIGLSKSGKTTLTTSILGFKLRKTFISGIPTLQSKKKLTGEYARLVNSP